MLQDSMNTSKVLRHKFRSTHRIRTATLSKEFMLLRSLQLALTLIIRDVLLYYVLETDLSSLQSGVLKPNDIYPWAQDRSYGFCLKSIKVVVSET